jgi:hypothetical protein
MNWSRRYWWPWIAASIVSWTIWAAVLATQPGHPRNGFWPVWVTVPWGAVLLAQAGRTRK